MVHLDIEYSQRKSLRLDMEIVLRTIPALWGQYCDMRVARRRVVRPVTNAGKSVESFGL
jgi:lipopolysaccharide/colanic/teichoic acid biosynthesis glycosyltransferase